MNSDPVRYGINDRTRLLRKMQYAGIVPLIWRQNFRRCVHRSYLSSNIEVICVDVLRVPDSLGDQRPDC